MADNKTLKDGGGTSFVFALKDLASVFYSKSIPYNDAGTAAAFGDGAVDAATLRVSMATDNVVTVDNGGTFVVQIDGAALTSLQLIDDAVALDDGALGKGILIQGDDGTDRKNINVDATTGDVQVDVTNTVTVSAHDVTQSGTWNITNVSGTISLPTGAATSANQSTANTSLSNIEAAVDVEGGALGSGILLQGDDGADRTNVLVDVAGHLQVDVLTAPTTTVNGTVTANLSVTDNTVLDTIETNTDYGTVTGGGTEAGALRVTVANDSTGTITVDGTVTANAGTGTMTVDLAGNNDVTIDGSAAIKTKQAAAGATDTGFPSLAVRNDDLADLAGVDGDYAPLQVTQNGALLMCPAANDDYKYEFIDDALSGNNTIVTAVASRKIRVLALFMVSAGTVTARFEDGAGGTALTGQMNLVANSGFTLPFNPAGWFETSVNTLLNLELSGAISVDGALTYIEVP